jgi:hypothetical protein
MSRDDLQADLLADLSPQAAPAPPPPPEPEPLPVPPAPHDATPALSMELTPLRWSRPRFVRASDGLGKAIRLGPLTVELSVKQD